MAINRSPPRTLTGPHTFELYLPEGASITETSVQTGKTQLKTAVVPGGEKNKYAFVFPIRPGQTQFHILYTVPYSGKLQINPRSDLATETLMVAAPDSIKFSPSDSSVYQTKTNPQFKNVNFFVAKNITAQQKVAFEISGKGEMPREQEQAAAPATGAPGRGEPAGPGGGLACPMKDLSRCSPANGCFWECSRFFWPPERFLFTPQTKTWRWRRRRQLKPQDRSTMLMEAMKEEVFQLESDRLQGKINPQDYQTAKAALDKTLQRAVQRQSKAT